jgi:Protein of unknown function (DUF4239)
MLFLTTNPIWVAALVLLVPTTLFAMAGPVIVRRYVGLEQLRTNNEVAGFKFATIGVIYAVLLAFAIVVVWERFNQADNDVAKEAGAAATVLRLSQGLDAPHAATIRAATTDYLKAAIARDWSAMAEGRPSHTVTVTLTGVYNAVLKYHSFDAGEALVVAEVLRKLDDLSGARRERLVVADGIVPGIIWMVLYIGAFLTIGFTFFFGTANLRAQVAMSGALSLLIFAGLLTITAIDHPFAGTVKVGPGALAAVLEDFADGAAH